MKRILSILLLGALASPALSQTNPTTAPILPKLSKEQSKRLNKGARKQYERCSSEVGQSVASDCLDSAVTAHDQLQDAALEALANQRACAFGNPIGCASYGKVLAAGGDVQRARLIWTSSPCQDVQPCQREMFWNLANTTPPDLPYAEKFGLPLCQTADDDSICQKLIALGSHLDYAAVVEGRKQRFIADLQSRTNKNDLAIPLLQANVSLNETNVNMQTGLAQLIAKGELKLAQAQLSSAQKESGRLHAQLDACQSGGPCGPPISPSAQPNVAVAAH